MTPVFSLNGITSTVMVTVERCSLYSGGGDTRTRILMLHVRVRPPSICFFSGSYMAS